MLHAYISTCPECFFLFTLLTGVLVKPGIIFRLGMSFSCGENWRVKHSNCVHLKGGSVLPLPLKSGRFKGGDLQWLHIEKSPPGRPPWLALLLNCLPGNFSQVLTFIFKTKYVTLSNLWSVQRYKSAKYSEIPAVKSEDDCQVTINFSTPKWTDLEFVATGGRVKFMSVV